jgi:hypothetical protein
VAPATIVLVSSKVTPLSSSLSQQKQPIAKPVEGHHQQQRQIVAAVTRARPVAGGRCNTVIARPGNHWRGGWWHSNINSRGRHGGGVRNHRRDIGICRRRDIGIGRRRLFIHDGSRGHNDFGDRRRNLSGCDYGSLRLSKERELSPEPQSEELSPWPEWSLGLWCCSLTLVPVYRPWSPPCH